MTRERQQLERIARHYHVRGDFDWYAVRFGARLMLRHAHGTRALEIGCADGLMTEQLARRFPRLVVVEASARYVRQVRRRLARYPIEFYTGLVEDFTPRTRFDTIICAHLLEHVRQPVALLRRLRSWLAPGGHVHVIVPNAGSLHRRLGVAMGLLARPTAFSPRDRAFGHRRVYERASLLRDVRRAGLRADRLDGVLLKPLSNAQMLSWPPRLLEALDVVGRELPDWCNELYVRCRR